MVAQADVNEAPLRLEDSFLMPPVHAHAPFLEYPSQKYRLPFGFAACLMGWPT
jgi:hypothetical protein